MATKSPPAPAPFGARLRALRQARGLSITAVADAAGIHRTHLSNLESGARDNPAWRTVQALVRTLGCSYQELEDLPPAEKKSKKCV